MKNSSIGRNDLFGASERSKDRARGREPWRGVRNGWLYCVLLGFAAIATFTLARPASAVPCVNSCPGGLVEVSIDGFPFCSGGANSGQSVCSGPSTPSFVTLGSTPVQQKENKTRFQPYNFQPSGFGGAGDDNDLDALEEEAALAMMLGHYLGVFGAQDNHLGMYVSNGGISGDVTAGGGGYSLRNGGVSMSDTAGLIAPGTNSTSYRENGGGGGISGTYDASRFVGTNQHLWFNGAFAYNSSRTNFGGVGAGSTINSDNYSFTGSALYTNYDTYLALKGSYQFGNNGEFDSSDSSTGSYRSDGYDIDARVGHVFWLLNTISQPTPSRMAVKAPPKPNDGYAIGLDLSGHLGYQNDVANGFTDSSGFVFGNERVQFGETGLKAKLFAVVQNYGVTWQPYVTGTVDWRFNYSHVANFPGQLALATGDAVTFDDATTFIGARLGLDAKMSNGWTIGANGFYEHSSDTEIVGGQAYVKIPFGAPVVTARY